LWNYLLLLVEVGSRCLPLTHDHLEGVFRGISE